MSKKAGTTARDLELLVLAWQSLKTSPQVDYELFAKKAGYKNAATACAQFSTLKRKVFALAEPPSSSSSDSTNLLSSSSSPAAKTPRKRRTPSKPAQGGTKNKKMTEFFPNHDNDNDDQESPSKKVKTELRMSAGVDMKQEASGGGVRGSFKLEDDHDGDDDDDKAISRQLDGSYDDSEEGEGYDAQV